MLKCITLCAPWAWAVTMGPKDVENRTWPIRYRGELLIHTGKGRDWFNQEALGDLADFNVPTRFGAHSPGYIVGIVNVVGCITPEYAAEHRMASARRFVSGPWCHVYSNRRWFIEPIPCTGARGLFDVEGTRELHEQIQKARPALWNPHCERIGT